MNKKQETLSLDGHYPEYTEFPSIIKIRNFIDTGEQLFMLCSLVVYLVCFVVFYQIVAYISIDMGKLFYNEFIAGAQTFTFGLAISNVTVIGYRALIHCIDSLQRKRYRSAGLFAFPFLFWLGMFGAGLMGYLSLPPKYPLIDSAFLTVVCIVSLRAIPWYASGNAILRRGNRQAPPPVITLCQLCRKHKITNVRHAVCATCQKLHQNYVLHIDAQLYRARKANLPATLTLPQWLAKLEHFRNRCAYCQMNPVEAIEHYIPIVKGGGTTDENCLPTCHPCNTSKGGNHPESEQS